jgi:hypothetical protein
MMIVCLEMISRGDMKRLREKDIEESRELKRDKIVSVVVEVESVVVWLQEEIRVLERGSILKIEDTIEETSKEIVEEDEEKAMRREQLVERVSLKADPILREERERRGGGEGGRGAMEE